MTGRVARRGCGGLIALLMLASAASASSGPIGGCLSAQAGVSAARSVVSVLAFNGPRVEVATGFSAGGESVVTVAHVVLGADVIHVVPMAGGDALPARVTVLDTRKDIAVLAVVGLQPGTVKFASGGATAGSCATVLTVRGGRVVRVDAQVRRHVQVSIDVPVPARRAALELAADIRRGDSGAPVLDGAGRVEGVVFAVSREGPPTAWAVDVSELLGLTGG